MLTTPSLQAKINGPGQFRNVCSVANDRNGCKADVSELPSFRFVPRCSITKHVGAGAEAADAYRRNLAMMPMRQMSLAGLDKLR